MSEDSLERLELLSTLAFQGKNILSYKNTVFNRHSIT